MADTLSADIAARFSHAADAIVDACRLLEQSGVSDEPIERLMLALEDVTQEVHRLHPPEAHRRFEPADLAASACRLAAGPNAPNRLP